jgi:hypothetical protein
VCSTHLGNIRGQGWAEMVEDHRPAIVELVREFYTNIHRRVVDSFLTWVRGMEIRVTPDLISAITGAPQVHNLEYPWPVDHWCTKFDIRNSTNRGSYSIYASTVFVSTENHECLNKLTLCLDLSYLNLALSGCL